MNADVPEDWSFNTANAILQEISGNRGLIKIDVCSDDDVKAGSLIEGAIHNPLEDFIDRKADWPVDEDATIFAYCSDGHRLIIAMIILMDYVYGDVRSLGG